MNKKFNKFLAFLLSLTMIISVFPMGAITASAAENEEINTVSESTNVVESGTWGGIDWTLTEDGTLTIAPTDNKITKTKPYSKTNPKELYQVGEVPAAVNDAISAITGWPFNRTAVKKLVIEEGVTSIGSFAFQGLTNLTGEVVIPSTVTYIGQEAFQKSPMTKLTFAKGGTGELCVGPGAFKELKITELVLPEDRSSIHIHCWAFNGCSKLETIVLPANVDLSSSKYYGWTHAEYEGMNYVYGKYATSSDIFATCPKITSIVFGSEEVKTNFFGLQGNQATFNKLSNVTVEVKVPSVAMIGEQGFETLSAALAVAKAGDNITLITDNNETVTINKSITIDGQGFTLGGTVNLAVPASNETMKFVDVVFKTANTNGIYISGTSYNVTFDACTFKGAASYSFEIPAGTGANNFQFINECEVDMSGNFMQISGTASDMLVDGMHIVSCSNGFKVNKCGNAITFNEVTVDGAYIFIYGMGYSDMSFAINNCTIKAAFPFVRQDKAVMTYTYTFIGENVVVADPDSTAPVAPTEYDGLYLVNGGDKGAKVVWVVPKPVGLVGSGTEEDPYQIDSVEDLILFRDSVNAGETKYNAPGVYVALTADIDLASVANWAPIGTWDYSFDGNFDGNGHKIMNLKMSDSTAANGEAYLGFFGITANNTIEDFVIENVTINSNGQIVAAAITYPYYTTVADIAVCGDIAIKGGNYTAGVLGYTRLCVKASNLTVSGNDGSYITGANVVGGIIADVQMNKGLVAEYSNFKTDNVTITGNKCVGGISGIIAAQTINGATVENVVLDCADSRVGVVAGSLGGASTISNVNVANVTGATAIVGGAYDGGAAVEAKVGDTYYATWEAAVAAANGAEVILFAPIVIQANENVTLEDVKIVYVSDVINEAMINNKGTLTITNSTISYTYTGKGDAAYTKGNYTIRNEGTLVVESGTIENISAQATHCNQAIFQYSGSTTINGGTFSTPAYRSVRLWKGNMTINGGTFVGQVWVQAVDNSSNMTINGGNFTPVANDASSVFVTNSTYDVVFTVTGGTFNGKIGCSNATKLAGAISGGLFTENAKNGTNTALLADNFVFKANGNGYYGIAAPVASVNGIGYATLAEAIKAAKAGDTITFLADMNENVTINKSLTIEGANKNYTGTMTVNVKSATINLNNINFVEGYVTGKKATSNGTYLNVTNCDFEGTSYYAISVQNIEQLTVTNCTAKNYSYGFIYVSNAHSKNVVVNNTTIENVGLYGIAVTSGCAVDLNNVIIKNALRGIHVADTSAKKSTLTNCTFENVTYPIAVSGGGSEYTVTFKGVNDLGNGTIPTATNVKYNGVQIGAKVYGTLAEAWAVAKDEDTIKLLGNIAIDTKTFTVADGKTITLDMNGKKITVTDNATKNYELFYIYGEMIVTGSGTIELTATNNRAWNAMSAIFHNRGGVLTIENGTFTHKGGTDMAFVVDNSGNYYGDAVTNIKGGTLTSSYIAIRNRMEQNTHGASGKAILNVTGGKIDGTSRAIWAQAASTSTVAPATGEINISGGTIGLIDTARSNGAVCMTTITGGTVAAFKGETGELTVKGGKITGTITICHDNGDVAKYKVVKDGVYFAAVAKVGTTYYATLQDAINTCKSGNKVTLVDNAKGPGVVINKDITINFANYTYTLTEGVGSTGTPSNGFQILTGNKVTLSAGTLKVAEEAAGKFYILIQNYADLSCFNMNLDGTYLDKWSKTDGDSYVISNNSGYISLTGKTYITTNNDGDKAFAFDACDSKYYADKPVVFAATTVKIDGKAVSESYDKIEAAARIGSTQFFAALKDAFAYASNGNTIKLMADVAVSEGITNTKKVTLDLNGKTITGTDNATGSFGLITNKGTLTITGNGKITLTATNNRGWNAYSSVISNTVGGKLIVENGIIEHLGGTDMAYGIDNLTNGKGTYAETIINGGTIKSSYRAIRMFLNGVEADNILTVKGGTIDGSNKAIWMQDPSKNANTGNLTVTKGATINGDVYLTVTAGSTEWPVEVSIAASAVNGEVLTSNVPESYKLVETKGVYSVEKVKVYIAQVGVTKYETLQAAIDACPEYGKVTLLRDAKGPGVVINKNITILFNNHTYTITEPVGSAGTETLGFQILKGNKVVLNSGKIEIAEEAADKFAILIQNYADLTVYNMVLDGTKLGRYENYSYVLSVNCGKVYVNGNSVLTAKDGEGNYALDVYDYSSAGYALPTVTVTSVVKINGKISAGAKYSTVYYATVEQAKAANPNKKVTVLN